MAPEQLRGAPVTSRADIYAFGLLMFEMVTGQLPFGDDSSLPAAMGRLIGRAPAAQRLVPELPAAWNNTIARCLEIAPERRFTSALQAVAALSGSTRGRPSANDRPRGWLRRTIRT
jgi:serine/threonine-protein kinase